MSSTATIPFAPGTMARVLERHSEDAGMFRRMVVSLIVALASVSVAHAQSRARVLWTASGAGAGFGVGLWAGLSAFDDAVDSDRKVWTSAIVGAGVGAVVGYLVARSIDNPGHPSTTTAAMEARRRAASERRMLEQLAKSFRFDRDGLDVHAPNGAVSAHSRSAVASWTRETDADAR
jgi:hypothetical protein